MKKSKEEAKNIGIVAAKPVNRCDDKNCPFHGKINLRGRVLTGEVISAKMRKTAVFNLERRHYIQKFERYETRRTRLKVHNPECISAKQGDKVRIAECRPLSKTKKFVIIERIE
jgi:small subunit ribosomal protein S17